MRSPTTRAMPLAAALLVCAPAAHPQQPAAAPRMAVRAPAADPGRDAGCALAPLAGPRIGTNLVALAVDPQWLAGDCFRWGHNVFPLFTSSAQLRGAAVPILQNQLRSNVRILQLPIFLGALRPPKPPVTAGLPCSEADDYCSTFHRTPAGAIFGCDHMLDIDNGGRVEPLYLARLGELIDLACAVRVCGAGIEEIVFRFGGQDKYELIRSEQGQTRVMPLALYPNLERAMETIIAFTKARVAGRVRATWDLAIEGAGLNTPWPHQRQPEVAEITRRLITKFAPLLPNQWIVSMANQPYRPAFFAQTLDEVGDVVRKHPPATRWAIDVYGGTAGGPSTGELLRETLTAIEQIASPIARDDEFMVVETWTESLAPESEDTYADIMRHVYDYYIGYGPRAMRLRSIAAWPIARRFAAQLPGWPINFGPVFATAHEGFGGPAIVRHGIVSLGVSRWAWLEGTAFGADITEMHERLYLEIVDATGATVATFDRERLFPYQSGVREGVATDLALAMPFWVVDQLHALGLLRARLCTRAGNGALLRQCSVVVTF